MIPQINGSFSFTTFHRGEICNSAPAIYSVDGVPINLCLPPDSNSPQPYKLICNRGTTKSTLVRTTYASSDTFCQSAPKSSNVATHSYKCEKDSSREGGGHAYAQHHCGDLPLANRGQQLLLKAFRLTPSSATAPSGTAGVSPPPLSPSFCQASTVHTRAYFMGHCMAHRMLGDRRVRYYYSLSPTASLQVAGAPITITESRFSTNDTQCRSPRPYFSRQLSYSSDGACKADPLSVLSSVVSSGGPQTFLISYMQALWHDGTASKWPAADAFIRNQQVPTSAPSARPTAPSPAPSPRPTANPTAPSFLPTTAPTPLPTVFVLLTGGTKTLTNGYALHTFASSGSFTVSGQAMQVQVLVAGGGGSGGGAGGAGGGGGGGVLCSTFALSPGTYTVTVGAGGASVSCEWGCPGLSGGASSISGGSLQTALVGSGGGGGGSDCCAAGGAGGCGGGGGYGASPALGSQGFGGGTGRNPAVSGGAGGGGGGGMGGVGASYNSGAFNGMGGPPGLCYMADSAFVLSAGGGAGLSGGTSEYYGRAYPGAGRGGTPVVILTSASANTGSGGGAVGQGPYGSSGGGGSGLVLVAYAVSAALPAAAPVATATAATFAELQAAMCPTCTTAVISITADITFSTTISVSATQRFTLQAASTSSSSGGTVSLVGFAGSHFVVAGALTLAQGLRVVSAQTTAIVANNGGVLTATGVLFSGNLGNQGGALQVNTGATATLVGCNFANNGASGCGGLAEGGAVAVYAGSFSCTSCAFTANVSPGWNFHWGGCGSLYYTAGGAVFNSAGTVTLASSSFALNTVGNGCGSSIYGTASSTTTVSRSTFSSNVVTTASSCDNRNAVYVEAAAVLTWRANTVQDAASTQTIVAGANNVITFDCADPTGYYSPTTQIRTTSVAC